MITILGVGLAGLGDYDLNKTIICHHYGCSWHTSDSVYYNRKQEIAQKSSMLADYLKDIEWDSADTNYTNPLIKKIFKIAQKKDLYHALENILKNNNIIRFVRFILKTLKDALRLIKFIILLTIRKNNK